MHRKAVVFILAHAVPCCAMLCYAMLCCAVLCCAVVQHELQLTREKYGRLIQRARGNTTTRSICANSHEFVGQSGCDVAAGRCSFIFHVGIWVGAQTLWSSAAEQQQQQQRGSTSSTSRALLSCCSRAHTLLSTAQHWGGGLQPAPFLSP